MPQFAPDHDVEADDLVPVSPEVADKRLSETAKKMKSSYMSPGMFLSYVKKKFIVKILMKKKQISKSQFWKFENFFFTYVL